MQYQTFYRTIQIDGLSVFYRKAGPADAPILPLLRGLPSSWMFEPLFSRLSDDFHLVAPDYPGHRQGDWPYPKQFAYTFDQCTEVIIRFTEALRLYRYALYMREYGGPVGFRMAMAHSDRIQGLVVQVAVANEEGLGANWKIRRAFSADRASHERSLRTNLLSLRTTRTRHAGEDPAVERYNPGLWSDEFAFPSQPGRATIQSDLSYDYHTNVAWYPERQTWMRETQPRPLLIWGKHDLSFEPRDPEAYRGDVLDSKIHFLDAGHFALDTAFDEVAVLVQSLAGDAAPAPVGRASMNLASISATASPMPRRFWAVLLAGGGIRLRDLSVRIVGDRRPKQFCQVASAESLLSETRTRLDPLCSGDRQVLVVSRGHERYYSKELADAKDSLVIAQPMNRGTAVRMIAALVQIMHADPEPGRAVLETQANPLCRVNRFWERPALPQTRALLESGCLWNTFVTIGNAPTFLELVCSELPDLVVSLPRALAGNDLAPTYARLPSVDFSRDILAHQVKRLLVLRDSGSGWAGLGSPDCVLGLLAKNVDQPAWFRQTHSFSHRSACCERSCDGSGKPRPRCLSRGSAVYRRDADISILEITGGSDMRSPLLLAAGAMFLVATACGHATRARQSYQNRVPFLVHNFGTFGIFDFGKRREGVREREAQLAQAQENVEQLKEEVSVRIEQSCNKVEKKMLGGSG